MANPTIAQQIDQLPEIISVTQLRYQTRRLQSLLLDKKKPIVLTVRSKKIALITPLDEKPDKKLLPKPPAYHLGEISPEKLRRVNLYKDYLKRKINAGAR